LKRLCGLLALLLLGAAGCGLPGQPKGQTPIPPDRVLKFDDLYSQNCSGCHGADGKMGPAPPLNDPLFRSIVPLKTVEEVVAGGRPGTLMPAWSQEKGGPLTAAQVAVLVNEIKGIPYRIQETHDGDKAIVTVVRDPAGAAKAWETPAAAPQDAPQYALPSETPTDDAARKAGATVFARACAACHGDKGQGVKQGDGLARTIDEPAFLALVSDQVLRRICITGRPDLGMPDYAHREKDPDYKPLTSQDVANLTALLSAWRQVAAPGNQEKPRGAP
jgi:mono/diheme cytochrome c family protein